MIRCLSCRHIFTRAEAMERLVTCSEPTTDWDRTPQHFTRAACPACSSEHLEHFNECLECKKAEAMEGDDLCRACRDNEEEGERQWRMEQEPERKLA